MSSIKPAPGKKKIFISKKASFSSNKKIDTTTVLPPIENDSEKAYLKKSWVFPNLLKNGCLYCPVHTRVAWFKYHGHLNMCGKVHLTYCILVNMIYSTWKQFFHFGSCKNWFCNLFLKPSCFSQNTSQFKIFAFEEFLNERKKWKAKDFMFVVSICT